MSRFTNPVPQFLDGNGKPVPGGKVYFYATGTTTLKNTFSNSALTIANTNPVILDANGRAPDIHLSGTYKVVLKDANEVELWSRDPIATGSDSQGEPWVNDKTYGLDDFVSGTDRKFYKSRTEDNQGNDPVSSPNQWKLILELSEYPINGGFKVPCRLATTANITLSGLQTLGGVQGVADDRVLVKDQTSGAENGIYLMKSGAWVRASDWDETGDVEKGVLVSATETTSSGIWQASFSGAFTLGTTSVTFTSQTSGGAAVATAQALLALGYKNDAETAKTGAETARTAAETAETGAETAKTGAETAKTGAETAEMGAETAKTAAETAQANAEKVFLGEFSSDPTTDNAGGALVAGKHFYYNSSTTLVRIYTTAGWKNATASVSGVLQPYTYTLAANQTVISGNDDYGVPLVIDNINLIPYIHYGDSVSFLTLYKPSQDSSGNDISGTGDYVRDATNNRIILTQGAEQNKKLSFVVFGDYSAQAASDVTFGNVTADNVTIASGDIELVDGAGISANGIFKVKTGSTPTERFRIDSSGFCHWGGDFTTVLNGFGGEDVSKIMFTGGLSQYVAINSNSANSALYISLSASATTNTLINFADTGSTVGSIATNGSSTSYNTTSDHRLKENLEPLVGAIDRVKKLDVYRGNFLTTPNQTVDMFVAHEAQEVVPESVTGIKDGMRTEEYQISPALGELFIPAVELQQGVSEAEDAIPEQIIASNIEQPEQLAEGQQWRETTPAIMGEREVEDYQGIDQAKLVPLLTAALQEALTKIESLDSRIAALEAE